MHCLPGMQNQRRLHVSSSSLKQRFHPIELKLDHILENKVMFRFTDVMTSSVKL